MTADIPVILSGADEARGVEGSPDLRFSEALDEYLACEWERMVADIASLVEVPSVEDMPAAAPGAPYGPGPRAALTAALALAARLGFEPHDMDGHVGYADAPAACAGGETPRQLGIIGHVDVVPTGPGWTVEPFAVTRREGYLLGRGVADDKGPLVVAMHALRAVRLWGQLHPEDALPFDTRIIIGCNEETAMRDVDWYRAHLADPDFLFTPDAEFPVGYGEKGIYHAALLSASIAAAEGGLEELDGGSAMNAVPGEARAKVRGVGEVLATGKTAHASRPDEGESAILRLIARLLEEPSASALAPEERSFLNVVARLTCAFDGSGADIACGDEDFGPLTMVGGVIRFEPAEDAGEGAHRIFQSIDIRYPTSITASEITARIGAAAEAAGATLRVIRVEEPYLTSSDNPEIGALLDAYAEVTGDTERGGFTMGGGTYARKFSRAASFGPEMPWIEVPAWVGGMHGADEGVSEELLRTAFKIYATAIMNIATYWREA